MAAVRRACLFYIAAAVAQGQVDKPRGHGRNGTHASLMPPELPYTGPLSGNFQEYSIKAFQAFLTVQGYWTPMSGGWDRDGGKVSCALQKFLVGLKYDIDVMDCRAIDGSRTIKALQSWLHHNGYLDKPIDGVFGWWTKLGLQKFLSENKVYSCKVDLALLVSNAGGSSGTYTVEVYEGTKEDRAWSSVDESSISAAISASIEAEGIGGFSSSLTSEIKSTITRSLSMTTESYTKKTLEVDFSKPTYVYQATVLFSTRFGQVPAKGAMIIRSKPWGLEGAGGHRRLSQLLV